MIRRLSEVIEESVCLFSLTTPADPQSAAVAMWRDRIADGSWNGGPHDHLGGHPGHTGQLVSTGLVPIWQRPGNSASAIILPLLVRTAGG